MEGGCSLVGDWRPGPGPGQGPGRADSREWAAGPLVLVLVLVLEAAEWLSGKGATGDICLSICRSVCA